MATTASSLYMSEHYVESAGAILFRSSNKEICILHRPKTQEYLLAKGKRNVGETRQQAAIREVMEETGISCSLVALDMSTDCPPAIEVEQEEGRARAYQGICEPIAVQVRQLSETEVKLVWWYVAVADEGKAMGARTEFDTTRFEVLWLDYDAALEKLSFEHDRELVKKACQLLGNTRDRMAGTMSM